MPGKHYPNHIVADHEGFAGTPRTTNAPYLLTLSIKIVLPRSTKINTKHTDVVDFSLHLQVGFTMCSRSQLMRILCPAKVFKFARTLKPSNSVHISLAPTNQPNQDLTIYKKSQITSISCKVIDISPCGRWNISVSSCRHSTKADIRPWSISLDGALHNPSKPTNLIISITRSSSIRSLFAISL